MMMETGRQQHTHTHMCGFARMMKLQQITLKCSQSFVFLSCTVENWYVHFGFHVISHTLGRVFALRSHAVVHFSNKTRNTPHFRYEWVYAETHEQRIKCRYSRWIAFQNVFSLFRLSWFWTFFLSAIDFCASFFTLELLFYDTELKMEWNEMKWICCCFIYFIEWHKKLWAVPEWAK